MTTNTKDPIVLYTDKQGNIELRADVEKDTLWATQAQIGQLFQVSSQNITMHLRSIFSSGELKKNSVCKESLHTGPDGKRYKVKFYNLDAIIAVGYRVNSMKATKFRIWATGILRDYLVKGFNLNKRKLTTSEKSFNDLDEALAYMKLESQGGPVKAKLSLKLTKDLVK